jgi:uroporphyrinogen-III synthase
VILTRPAGRNEALAARLRQLGCRIVVCPLIRVETIETGPLDLSGYDWVVLTSTSGAKELRRRGVGAPRRVAAIGRATAQAWGAVDLVPSVSTQEGLLEELPRPAGRVLFAGAAGARKLLVDELEADFVALYRTVALVPAEPVRGDLAVLASPSAARSLARLGLTIPAVTIGPETTAAARGEGIDVVEEARSHDLDGLVAAVVLATG